MFAVNVRAPFFLTAAYAPQMAGTGSLGLAVNQGQRSVTDRAQSTIVAVSMPWIR